AGGPRSSRLAVEAHARPFMRALTYNDDLMQRLRSYEIAAPSIVLEAAVYPVRRGILRNVGVAIAAEHAVGIRSENPAGEIFPTSSFELAVSVRARATLGRAIVVLAAGYGQHRFSIDESDGGYDPEIPSVSYQYVRGGVSLAYPITDRLAVRAGLA